MDKEKLFNDLVKAYNDHINTKEEKEFIHVFRRILIEHHMDSKLEGTKKKAVLLWND